MMTLDREQLRRAFNCEHELDAISAALLSPDGLDDVAAVVEPRHFKDERCRAVFEALLSLRTSGLSTTTEFVAPLVAKHGVEVNDLFTMLEAVPHAAHATLYAERVRRAWVKRELQHLIINSHRELIQPDADPDEVAGQLVQRVESVLDGDQRDDSNGLLGDWLLKLTDEPDLPRFTTGLMPLDALTGGGLAPGQLVCVGARPGVGKTSLLTGIALAAAQAEIPGLLLSCEMSAIEMSKRFLCHAGLRLEDSLDMNRAASWPLYLKEAGGWSIERIETEARRFVRKHGLKVLLVDYLSLVRARDERLPRYEQVADISRSLKRLAVSLGVAVVAAQQLNRDIEKRQIRRPLMSDFRESGSIEQDADILIAIERAVRPDEGDRTQATLYILKHRNGETADIPMEYIPASTRFRSIPEHAPGNWG